MYDPTIGRFMSPSFLAAQRRMRRQQLEKEIRDATQKKLDDMERLLKKLDALNYKDLLEESECPFELEELEGGATIRERHFEGDINIKGKYRKRY